MNIDQQLLDDALTQLLLMSKVKAGDAEYFAFAQDLKQKIMNQVSFGRLIKAESEAESMYKDITDGEDEQE